MNNDLRITLVVENTARKAGLLAEHGLSYWIELGGHGVLFDTGQGQVLAPNAERLRIDLGTARAVVLSHGHFDHTGGLRYVFHLADQAKVFLHPQAMLPRYTLHRGQAAEIGLAALTKAELERERHRLVWTTQPTEIVPGICATGAIPRVNNYEDTGGDFFLDAAGHVPDPIVDDQAIYVDTDSGVVVVLGCAHAGVVNTLEYVGKLTGRPILAAIGGTHLVNASPERVARTIGVLRQMGVKLVVPCHCTGPRAMAALWTALPNQIADGCVGTHLSFPAGAVTSADPR